LTTKDLPPGSHVRFIRSVGKARPGNVVRVVRSPGLKTQRATDLFVVALDGNEIAVERQDIEEVEAR
jgi:hypothetical protein